MVGSPPIPSAPPKAPQSGSVRQPVAGGRRQSNNYPSPARPNARTRRLCPVSRREYAAPLVCHAYTAADAGILFQSPSPPQIKISYQIAWPMTGINNSNPYRWVDTVMRELQLYLDSFS